MLYNIQYTTTRLSVSFNVIHVFENPTFSSMHMFSINIFKIWIYLVWIPRRFRIFRTVYCITFTPQHYIFITIKFQLHSVCVHVAHCVQLFYAILLIWFNLTKSVSVYEIDSVHCNFQLFVLIKSDYANLWQPFDTIFQITMCRWITEFLQYDCVDAKPK